MPTITPFLWHDNTAEAALELYSAAFPGAQLLNSGRLGGADSQLTSAALQVLNQQLILFNGGPDFKPTPAFSFTVSAESPETIQHLWQVLGNGGSILMDLAEYPFAELFGWTADRFGFNWQLIQRDGPEQITPSLMFINQNFGAGDRAIELYTGLFPNSGIDAISRFPEGSPDAGKIMTSAFHLAGSPFAIQENSFSHQFGFSEATSLMVLCADQAEVDHYWDGLTARGGAPGRCGWLKDPFGVSWQIVPERMLELFGDPDPEVSRRAQQAMLGMNKLVIADLEAAAAG